MGGGTATGGGGAGGSGGGAAACTPLAGPAPSGGCQLTLVGPADCAVLDFSAGPIEFSWTTSATFCEGPHHFQIGGDPPSTWTTGNAIDWSLSSGTHNGWWMERNIGGWMTLSRSDFAALTSVNGQYAWRIVSYYGSASEVRTFTIKQ